MKRDFYVMDVNKRRNCYSYEGFDYLTRNYRNWRLVGQARRIEHRDNVNMRDNLKEEESLVVLIFITNSIY